jgi:hypothetical protein
MESAGDTVDGRSTSFLKYCLSVTLHVSYFSYWIIAGLSQRQNLRTYFFSMHQGPGVLETKKLIVIETHLTPVYKVGSLPTKTRVKSFGTSPKTFISKGTPSLSV